MRVDRLQGEGGEAIPEKRRGGGEGRSKRGWIALTNYPGGAPESDKTATKAARTTGQVRGGGGRERRTGAGTVWKEEDIGNGIELRCLVHVRAYT